MDDSEKLDAIYEATFAVRSDLKQIKETLNGTVERPDSGLITRVERLERHLNFVLGALGFAGSVGTVLATIHGLWPFSAIFSGNKP
jgi:hypothetical protein